MPLNAGTRLGPYEVVAAIGAGGMGEVYKARDTRLERTVAIKVLPATLAADPEFKTRFEREAKSISALNHPHICTLYDVGSQDGTDFLVMEHLEGETLAARLTRGALPADDALEYAMQIADALDKAHRQGIVHRDLKPANVFLGKTTASGTPGVCKLLDFGLAKLGGGPAPGTIKTKLLTSPPRGNQTAPLKTSFTQMNGEVSPDGRWILYQSGEGSTMDEVHVRPYPDTDAGHWQISTSGGRMPFWSRSGREIFYIARQPDRLMVAPITPVAAGAPFVVGTPVALFPAANLSSAALGRTFDISPDDKRFVFVRSGDSEAGAPPALTVIVHWLDSVKARVMK